jgi:hypothetical protein
VTHEPVDRRRLALVSAVSVVVIGATGLAAYACGGDVPRGTRVLGVDLGGRSRTDAERILHHHFDTRAGEPVEVVVGDRHVKVSPSAIGMTLDVDQTVGKAIRSGAPLLTGERTSPPVIRLDRKLLATALGARVRPYKAAAAIRSAWLTGRPAVVPMIP